MKSLVVLNECMFDDEQKNILSSKFKNVAFYKDTSDEETAIKRAAGSNIIVTDQFMWNISDKFLKACSQVELIILNTTAYDRVPVRLLKERQIKLSNLKQYATKDVAELALSMMMYLNCRLDIAREIVKKKGFNISNYKQDQLVRDIWPGHHIIPLLERKPIKKQVAGIVGLGKIGIEIANLCQKLDLQIIGYNRTNKMLDGIELVSLENVFKRSDVIFIALRYDPKTMTKFISSKLLAMAKIGATFISIAPSELIDIPYLIANSNKFGGLGFDCYVTDELIKLNRLKKPNIIITPHLGHQSFRAYSNLTNSIIETAIGFSEHKPVHLLDL